MPSIAVDQDDLETIIWATAAIKAIEGALAQRKSDPFVRPRLDYTAAHDRLASALRNAKRVTAGTLVPWDGPLTDAEFRMLRGIKEDGMRQFNGPSRFHHPEVDSLVAKGCVVMGQRVDGVIWAGAATPELAPMAMFAVKITDRGREKLAKIEYSHPEGVPVSVENLRGMTDG